MGVRVGNWIVGIVLAMKTILLVIIWAIPIFGQYGIPDTFAVPQTPLANFLDLYEEYEKVCETPTEIKEFVEYDTVWSLYDTITVKSAYVASQNTDNSYSFEYAYDEYHNHKTKTAWKFITKTYKPCFEGFILFLKDKLKKEGKYYKSVLTLDDFYIMGDDGDSLDIGLQAPDKIKLNISIVK